MNLRKNAIFGQSLNGLALIDQIRELRILDYLCLTTCILVVSGCLPALSKEERPLASTQITQAQAIRPKTEIYADATTGLVGFQAFKLERGQVQNFIATSSGQRAYASTSDGAILELQYLAKSNQLDRRQIYHAQGLQTLLALSQDETLLAIAEFSSITVLDLTTLEVKAKRSDLRGGVTAISWDPLQEYLIFGQADGTIYAWSWKQASALETYLGASSAIEKIIVHPLGRIFFAGERDGQISVFRLIRTDYDLGLRDPDAAVDLPQSVRKIQTPSLGTRIDDMWLESNGAYLFVSASDGQVYPYKIRGIKQLPPFKVSADFLVGFTGIEQQILFFGAATKDQRLRFFCFRNDGNFTLDSATFLEPLEFLTAKGGILWATQKSGNIIRFDLKLLSADPAWAEQSQRCLRTIT
ncbi:WD40 repeat domain-containing protein [bacterium]|nr:WD40 repeat domain-containing protein [bacterium]